MKRLLILTSKLGYQARSFTESARALGVDVAFGSDRCGQLEDPWADRALALHFEQPQAAARQIVEQARRDPIDGLLALGDRPTATAAYAARALGLPYHAPEAVESCRSKLRQREILREKGLAVPAFLSFLLEQPLETVLPRLQFPCVVKPLRLAASQGVIRADDADGFRSAVARIRALLESPEIQATRESELDRVLVENYLPGREVAVEGLMSHGRLRILAIFDKPDPLEGPFFEESIYVTPSRLAQGVQERIAECTRQTVQALGLEHGPVHAEFRVRDDTPWILEVAPRPIGGLCARALRFGPQRIPLEELLVRHALALPDADLEREDAASGVMMIPVPATGVLEAVSGEENARATPGIEEILITARLHDSIAAWPEGSSYLGFIFARSDSAEVVEAALRAAHGRLGFQINPRLPVGHPVTGKLPVAGSTS